MIEIDDSSRGKSKSLGIFGHEASAKMSQRKSKLKTTSWEIPAETKESLKTVQFDVWKYDNDQVRFTIINIM